MVDVINPCGLHHNEQGECVGPCTTQLPAAAACLPNTPEGAKACMDAFRDEILAMRNTLGIACLARGCDHLTELTSAFNGKVKDFWESYAGGVLHMDQGNEYNTVVMPGLSSQGTHNTMRYCIPKSYRDVAKEYALKKIDELHGIE